MNHQRTYAAETFRIDVTAGERVASLHVDAGVAVSAVGVIAKLKEIGITKFDDGVLIEALQARKDEELTFVIARGVPRSMSGRAR